MSRSALWADTGCGLGAGAGFGAILAGGADTTLAGGAALGRKARFSEVAVAVAVEDGLNAALEKVYRSCVKIENGAKP